MKYKDLAEIVTNKMEFNTFGYLSFWLLRIIIICSEGLFGLEGVICEFEIFSNC